MNNLGITLIISFLSKSYDILFLRLVSSFKYSSLP